MRKAVLMVSASDANNDGPIPVQGIDGKDGAGAPDLARAKWMIDSGKYLMKYVTPANLSGGQWHHVVDIPFYGRPGGGPEALRMAMVWDSCVENPVGFELPNVVADFDLYVSQPVACGGAMLMATRTDTEFEMMYDQCLSGGATGVYSAYIRQKQGTVFSLCGVESSEPIAIAWDISLAVSWPSPVRCLAAILCGAIACTDEPKAEPVMCAWLTAEEFSCSDTARFQPAAQLRHRRVLGKLPRHSMVVVQPESNQTSGCGSRDTRPSFAWRLSSLAISPAIP